MNGKDVALVLSSGGPRGWAYIGAIEELESRGYRIRSVAGTSIGSLNGFSALTHGKFSASWTYP